MIYLVIVTSLVLLGLLTLWARTGSGKTTNHPLKNTSANRTIPTSTKRSKADILRRAHALAEQVANQDKAENGDTVEVYELPPVSLRGLILPNEEDLNRDARQRLNSLTQYISRPKSILLELVQGKDDPAQLFQLVSSDPGSAAMLLSTVNSAQFHLTTKIESVERAITYLGAKLVRDIVLSNVIKADHQIADSDLELLIQRLWKTSYLASGLTAVVAQQLRFEAPSRLSTQALFFNLGDIMMLTHLPELKTTYSAEMTFPDRIRAIQDKVGFNSAVTGSMLARNWELPDNLVTALKHSLMPLVAAPPEWDVDELRGFTLSYMCYRLADIMNSVRTNNVLEAQTILETADEYFYFGQYVEEAGLSKLGALLTGPSLASKIKPLTSHLPIQI